MANLHAAIGLEQLKKMVSITASRQQTCKLYNDLLATIPHITTPISNFENVTPFLYYIRVPGKTRKNLIDYLKNKGIDTGIHWQPGHMFELFSQYPKGDLAVTEKIGEQILSLPLHSNMNAHDVELIASEIKYFFENLYE
jgi:dTDP-4-amino-4,6-dideoxygalactose transaminase